MNKIDKRKSVKILEFLLLGAFNLIVLAVLIPLSKIGEYLDGD